ncbi:MAG: HlyD family efflux transporter periplasmic adaptor subunit [Saccharofermentanales bacterium]
MKKKTVSSSRNNRGIIYIILIAFFTLVMIADLLNLALTPARDTIDFSNFDPSSFSFSDGSGEVPNGQFPMPGRDVPEGFTPPGGKAPEDFTMPDGEVPDGFTPPKNGGFSMPEGGFSFPGGNTGEFPSNDRQPIGGGNGFLSLVHRAWLPILIVCLLGNGVCLFLYIRLRRKSSTETQRILTESEEDSADDETAKKKKKGGWILPMCLVIAVAAVIASLPSPNSKTDTVSANEQVISATAKKGTISTVLSGTGTLADETAKQVNIPHSITVTAYHVNNGDTAAEGDVLASIDEASVGVAIAELQTVIDELDTDLYAASKKSADTKITAAVDGRVKVIYAQENASVLDIVSEHGCLMLISLDGLMAVDLEAVDGVSVGDTVKVILSDGTKESGRVSAKEDGILTVTISDESAIRGDAVSIWKEDGQQLGEGCLYIHSELRITGYYGNISSVPVEVNALVDEGDTLVKLSDAGHTSAYQNLLKRRKQLEDQMDSLFRLYQDGYLRAESDGIISGIPEDSTVVSLAAQSKDNEADLSGANFVNTSAAFTNPSASLASPMTLSYRGTAQVKTLSHSPTGEDDSNLQNFAATVVSADEESVQFSVSSSAIGEVDYTDLSGLTREDYEYSGSYFCAVSAPVYLYQGGTWKTISAAELLPGEFCVITIQATAAEPMMPVWIVCNRTAAAPEQSFDPQQPTDPTTPSEPGASAFPSQGSDGSFPSVSVKFSSFSGSANESPQEEETKTYEQYSLAEKHVLSITSQESMSVTISVDELDILSLRENLPVKITLEALKGQEFAGTISEIGRTGTNEGGNTKYSVTVSLPKEENLIAGMNAAVKIVTAEREAAITIPAAALVESGGKTYVYTSYDEKKDALGGLVKVETGASDGEIVEILSGIENGDSVFYRYADTLIYNFFSTIGK